MINRCKYAILEYSNPLETIYSPTLTRTEGRQAGESSELILMDRIELSPAIV
jgi:hypothetical protein